MRIDGSNLFHVRSDEYSSELYLPMRFLKMKMDDLSVRMFLFQSDIEIRSSSVRRFSSSQMFSIDLLDKTVVETSC